MWNPVVKKLEYEYVNFLVHNTAGKLALLKKKIS
jgi:hypothetical protein